MPPWHVHEHELETLMIEFRMTVNMEIVFEKDLDLFGRIYVLLKTIGINHYDEKSLEQMWSDIRREEWNSIKFRSMPVRYTLSKSKTPYLVNDKEPVIDGFEFAERLEEMINNGELWITGFVW